MASVSPDKVVWEVVDCGDGLLKIESVGNSVELIVVVPMGFRLDEVWVSVVGFRAKGIVPVAEVATDEKSL